MTEEGTVDDPDPRTAPKPDPNAQADRSPRDLPATQETDGDLDQDDVAEREEGPAT